MEIRSSYRNQNQKKFHAVLCFVDSLTEFSEYKKAKLEQKQKKILTLEDNFY